MNPQSILAVVNTPASLAATIGALTAIAAISAFLPLRNGNGQHAGAGPGAVDVWKVRECTTERTADTQAASESPPTCDTQPPEPEPQPDMYGYRDLYRCRSIAREIPTPETFDIIGVQLLDTSHSVEQTQPVPTIGHCWYDPTRAPSIPRGIDRAAPRPPTNFERFFAQGIQAALDPSPYIGRHRLRTAENPEPHRLLSHAA